MIGEIPAAARRQLRESAQRLFSDPAGFDRWLGRFVTAPPRNDRPGARARLHNTEAERFARAWRGVEAQHSPALRMATGGRRNRATVRRWRELRPRAGDGSKAELLCGRTRLDRIVLDPLFGQKSFAGTLVDLVLRGFLIPDDAAGGAS